jgi:tetratricopeptide (TPR) repeat protein
MPLQLRLGLVVALFCTGTVSAAAPKGDDALMQLLQTRNCPECQLADVDLVHAQLQDADLAGAKLQRANLSQARLDGANLRGADLSFTSLNGASLRGADLQGSTLLGTDLRDVDLTGASLDLDALESAHWSGAIGLQAHAQSHASLHNAGVTATEVNRWREAEGLFGLAILKRPEAAESWIARGITREQLGKRQLAIRDYNYARNLYTQDGNIEAAEQLELASKSLEEKVPLKQSGNGAGSAILTSILSTSQALLPMAMKLFMPALGL